MNWQLGAFFVLAGALAAGFTWYERSRPDARIIALVATLAAFAALGRIAFAALPNVKPTTDIVLVSGYALGGAPGFIVGALAGLTSNFFFGQGPWTPWQMAAWGATGMLGAGVAMLTRRRIGRWPLAITSALAGFAFAAFQDVGDWVNFSDHSLAQLGVYVGKGIGFDFIHAFACLLFALALGPALIRSLQRFAMRLQVTWRPAAATAPALLAAVALAAAMGLAAPAPARAASPTDYLLAAQNPDGGFGPAPRQGSTQLFSGWAALGLAAEGRNPQDLTRGGRSVIDYIQAGGSQSDVGSLERTILVLRAAGLPAGAAIASLRQNIRGDGSVSDQVNLTSFAVLALRSAGLAPPAAMLSWLVRQQDQDGGFNFATAGGSSDPDDTGAALEALAGAAPGASARAVRFLRSQQNPDGGFPSTVGGDSNAQSTAWAIQGLIAAGVDPSSLRHSPLGYLNSLIAPDGHVRYSSGTDQTPVWVTAQAAMALAGKPLPIEAIPHQSAPTRSATSHATQSSHAARQRRAARRRHSRPQRISSQGVQAFVTDAGVAAALMLAPVGLG
jgi:prenyltransferase beta subunit